MVRRVVLIAVLACAPACARGGVDPPAGSATASYDKTTGRLKELEYDAARDGRTDVWTEMDGARALRSRVDRDGDGRVDRWEYYDDRQRLVKVGFSRAADGVADAWAFSAPDGTIQRIEISSRQNEQQIDRIEYYEAGSSIDRPGTLVRADVDANRDGRIDRWETFAGGELHTIAYDENGDGVADRRLTYEAAALVLIESQPDGAGRFMKRVQIKESHLEANH
jgi:hypothetical protein